ncbi:chitinase class I [Teladorsagia circumcincta]|uniref:Chitinase class I n=1 Tax=Teladorsagia circumcincta TaxID=45464 RepID=A0A2G9V5S5_TELCI|nr:chitinase class I [Teladorsagia circumcincta]
MSGHSNQGLWIAEAFGYALDLEHMSEAAEIRASHQLSLEKICAVMKDVGRTPTKIISLTSKVHEETRPKGRDLLTLGGSTVGFMQASQSQQHPLTTPGSRCSRKKKSYEHPISKEQKRRETSFEAAMKFHSDQPAEIYCDFINTVHDSSPPAFCPPHSIFAKEVSDDCEVASDPNNLKKSPIEKWFKEEMFNDLFPKANLGLGPHDCLPYSYKSFIIAARYFPEFGGESSNKVVTKMDPPLAMLASLWFYMTPQPPKPSMHSIVVGDWRQSEKNRRAGFSGPIFGPTSLVINNECGGEDPEEPGMLDGFDAIQHMYSWQPDWGNMWRSRPCDCEPAPYGGALPYYDPKLYPSKFGKDNDRNRLRCVYSIYESPTTFRLDEGSGLQLTAADIRRQASTHESPNLSADTVHVVCEMPFCSNITQ